MAILWKLFGRRRRRIEARLVFLEQREDEITTQLLRLTREIEAVKEARLELARILPPLRSAMALFNEFNRTY